MSKDKIKIPQHVAIIMDGNGRWAKARFLPRVAGHRKGAKIIRDVAFRASQLGVKILTLYAFSTENWGRPKAEVEYLMNLPREFFADFLPQAVENNIKISVIGDIVGLPEHTHYEINRALEETASCDGMVLNFALNYGGRQDILKAVQILAQKVASDELSVDNITMDDISVHLSTQKFGHFQDPDLIIRTSGEQRLSNFLLWEAAYSEFYFTEVFWPDFTPQELDKAFASYQQRQRRYGKIEE